MGCCLSTTEPKSHKPNPIAGGAPPPPPPLQPFEEETVKEVLSETPIITKPNTTYKNHLHPEIQPTAAIRPNNNHRHHHQPPNHLHPVPEQPRVQPTAAIKPNNNSSSYHQPSILLHPVAEQPRIQPTAAIKPNKDNSYHQPSNLLQPRVQPTAEIKPSNNSYHQASNHLHPVPEQQRIQPTAPAVKPTDEIVSEVSDLSELYSYSESLSTVTENFIENNDGEVNQQRVHHRSPVKNVPRRRKPAAAGAGRTPARRSEPSPVRRGQASQGRNSTPARRNAGPSSVIRRDAAGEGSGRRSRSPATRGDGAAQRPARSHDRRSRTPAGRRDARDGVSGAVMPETMPAPEEKALDDPNVSLECFIFL